MPKWTPDPADRDRRPRRRTLVSAAASSWQDSRADRACAPAADGRERSGRYRPPAVSLLLPTQRQPKCASESVRPSVRVSRKPAGYRLRRQLFPRAPRENHDCACAVPVARAMASSRSGARHRARLSPDGRKRGQAASRRGARRSARHGLRAGGREVSRSVIC